MPELLLSLNLFRSWTLHILYNISHWQLRILGPPLDFGTPKNCHWGGGATASPAPLATTPLVSSIGLTTVRHNSGELFHLQAAGHFSFNEDLIGFHEASSKVGSD